MDPRLMRSIVSYHWGFNHAQKRLSFDEWALRIRNTEKSRQRNETLDHEIGANALFSKQEEPLSREEFKDFYLNRWPRIQGGNRIGTPVVSGDGSPLCKTQYSVIPLTDNSSSEFDQILDEMNGIDKTLWDSLGIKSVKNILPEMDKDDAIRLYENMDRLIPVIPDFLKDENHD